MALSSRANVLIKIARKSRLTRLAAATMFNFKNSVVGSNFKPQNKTYAPKVSEEFSGCKRVWARRRAPVKGVFRHRHQRKSLSYWPPWASCVVKSTMTAISAPTEHVCHFRHTCSAESPGHAMAKLPIAGRQLIMQDEPSRS